MASPFRLCESFDADGNVYRRYDLTPPKECLATAAEEYRRLRVGSIGNLTGIQLDGIDVVDISALHNRLVAAVIPAPSGSPLDVVRSDLGEVLAYMVLENEFGTTVPFKLVRERELPGKPGRGIDAIGIEAGDPLTLVLCEAKVSDEDAHPPQVVDAGDQSIKKTLVHRLTDKTGTGDLIFAAATRTSDEGDRNLLLAAGILWEEEDHGHLQVVGCGVLVRPTHRFHVSDFGSLRTSPDTLKPAKVRLLLLTIDGELATTVDRFHKLTLGTEVS